MTADDTAPADDTLPASDTAPADDTLPASDAVPADDTLPKRDTLPVLDGPRVRLRPWRADDVEAVSAACQDAEIQRWTQVPVPYRREDAEHFVTVISAEMVEGGGASYAVVDAVTGALVGSMGLFPPDDGVGEIGYWTVAEHRGRGLTAEAVGVLGDWATVARGLHRLELLVDPANTGSRRVAERAGYTAEGVVRQRWRFRGTPADVVLYSRLPGDPAPPR